MIRRTLVLLLLLPFTCFAQYSVSGKVLSQANKAAVPRASVFLSNSFVGTVTDSAGAFELSGIKPGQYELVISVLGFETVHKNVLVNADIKLPDITLAPKTIVLSEVRIESDETRARNYATFLRLFLGDSPFAADCKIINPDVIDITNNRKTFVLTASSDDFIVIENNALGYRVKYLLTNFSNDAKTGILYYEGSAFFEKLAGPAKRQRVWDKNRLDVYLGSSMDFLHSVIGNDLDADGFKVLRLVRKLIPEVNADTIKKYKETLYTAPLAIADFVKLTPTKGIYALNFNDCLYVMYSRKRSPRPVDKLIKSGEAVPDHVNGYVTTTIIFESKYALFDGNGIFLNPASVLFDGQWGKSRMAELLPVDYDPGGGD